NLYFDSARDVFRSTLGSGARSFLRSENALFAGFLPTVLFLTGIAALLLRRGEGPPDPWRRGLLLSGALCFALTFPGIYAPLMRVVPGLSGMRVPARFYAFVSLTLVYLAAHGVDFLMSRASGPRTRAALATALALILAVELA